MSALQARIVKLEQSLNRPTGPTLMFVQFISPTAGPIEARSALCGDVRFEREDDEAYHAFRERIESELSELRPGETVLVIDDLDAEL